MDSNDKKELVERLVILELLLSRTLAITLHSHPNRAALLSSIEYEFLDVLRNSDFAESKAFSVVNNFIKLTKKNVKEKCEPKEHIFRKRDPFLGC